MSEMLSYINNMRISYSYKPVLLLALIQHDGHISIPEAADFFFSYYRERIRYGLIAEKSDSIFSNLNCDRKAIEENIRSNPVKALLNSGLFFFTNDVLITKEPLTSKDALANACYRRLDRYFEQIDETQRIRCFHKPQEENGYLSNWYPSHFSANGKSFSSAEQFIMFNKAMLFDDTATAYSILKTDDVARIQQLGRGVLHYNDQFWDGNRQVIAYKGLLCKFTQNQTLKDLLVDTGNDVLAECSVSDTIWGIGVSMHDTERYNMDFWKGRNLLGYTLMQVRMELAGK